MAVPATLCFSNTLAKSDPKDTSVLIVGQLKHLQSVTFSDISCKLAPRVDEETFKAGIAGLHPSPTDTCSLWLNKATVAALPLNSSRRNTIYSSQAIITFKAGIAGLHPSPTDTCSLWLNKATVAALPLNCSRHNTPSRAHSLSKLVKSCLSGGDEYVVVVCERKDVFASSSAISKILPLFNTKTSGSSTGRTITVEFVLVGDGKDSALSDDDVKCLDILAQSTRLAAKIVDMPCADMHTNVFLEEVRSVGKDLGIEPMIIQGEDLIKKGFGGIYNVGKAAINLPAIAVLSHRPAGAERNIAWVGKGIVFDTGGLCIKSKTGMCGMKTDCGGAAGILGAFRLAVKMGFKENLHAIFCIAENAVGPIALRPDDIITLYSGKTVEINNTDAEGRLVLGDGVAYAKKECKADVVVDMATLTGAQGIATGKYHASLLTNTEEWEGACMNAGRNSGELVFPVPYSPELHFPEFNSMVADMKNSVADRGNAQPSCAGLFIGSHLGFDFPGVWIHVDMAAPAHVGDRATGYGPALLNTLFGKKSSSKLLQSIAPDITLKESMDTQS